MANKGTLKIKDSTDVHTILEFEYYICRAMEANGTGGRPSITNFKITIIAPEKCRDFYTWMLKDKETRSGEIDLIVEVNKGTHLKIIFKDAYCRHIYEGYNHIWDEKNMTVMVLFITPTEIELLDGKGKTTSPNGVSFNNITGVCAGVS